MNKAILLTPAGAAAIAVVRLTGEKTAAFLQAHFSRTATPGRAVHGELRDGETAIDDPVVVMHAGGLTADINAHGGPWVVRQVLDLAGRAGFEVIESPGVPLPDEAVDGRDEFERRMVAHLPLARTELALRWLLAQPAAWRRRARISRSSPRIPPEGTADLDPSLYWLLHPPAVAIVGAANVGKSTLANQLFAQERSITADVAGTTRDWVGEIADIDGLAVFLMDTPGLRATDDAIEQAAIAASGERIRTADLVVLVVNATSAIGEQRDWVRRYPAALVVRNQCDRGGEVTPIDASRPHVHTVGVRGEGIDLLRQAIRRRFVRGWRHAGRARGLTAPLGALNTIRQF